MAIWSLCVALIQRTFGVRSAISKNVQFYEFKVRDETAELTALHDGTLRIDRQPQTVTQYLEYIKAQAK